MRKRAAPGARRIAVPGPPTRVTFPVMAGSPVFAVAGVVML
jgi:hypothetical protein